MIDAMQASAFVEAWLASWNAHDVEGVLSHFHEDAVFASPVAARLFPEGGGVARGRSEIRDYWTHALTLIGDLRFELERYFVGVDAIVIQYRNHRGMTVDEVLVFDGDRVRSGYGTYLPEDLGVLGVTRR